jgi:hypothetical protein
VGYFCNFQTTAQTKQSSNGRKLAQCGHTVFDPDNSYLQAEQILLFSRQRPFFAENCQISPKIHCDRDIGPSTENSPKIGKYRRNTIIVASFFKVSAIFSPKIGKKTHRIHFGHNIGPSTIQ